MSAAAPPHHCPHCRKAFDAELLGSQTERAGFKCPHCKLFVPLKRAGEDRSQAA